MSSKTNGIEWEWARAPPKSGPLIERIGKAIYNPEDNSFLGRTPKRWGVVLLFYTVFYAVLAVLFSLCMGGLFLSLDYKRPTYVLDKSLIGSNPGVAYRPLPENGLIIKYSLENATHHEIYATQLMDFLLPYANETWFNAKSQCNEEDNFGYPNTPCIFVKLNKLIDWKPEYYNDVNALPEDMPDDLAQHIKELPKIELNQVWISCREDTGNATKIEYPWGRGLPGRFYPYVNKEGYRSPLLAVKLFPPTNALTTIRCRAWAKNILFNKSLKEPSGYTQIQLLIQDTSSSSST